MKNIEFLYLDNSVYFIFPILILIVIWFGYKKKAKILSFFKLSFNPKFKFLRFLSFFIGLSLIGLALLGPMTEIGVTEVSSSGLDIYVLMDTSKSMLVEDVLPSRLEKGKTLIEDLVNQLDGDRIGFIPFSSTAYVQMPLTDDYELAKMFIEVMDTDMISGGGSNLAKALEVAKSSFDLSATGDKVILVISDGEEQNAEAEKLIKTVKEDQIHVYAIGMGTIEGGLIPEYDSQTNQKIGYKKDSEGHAIMSKLNESMLKTISTQTNGKYYQSTLSTSSINELVNEFSGLQKSEKKTNQVKNYEHFYQYFLGIGLLLLFMALVIPERRMNHED